MGSRALSHWFIDSSFSSAFGVFGWMNQPLPTSLLHAWTVGFFFVGLASLLWHLVRRGEKAEQRQWHFALFITVCANIFSHFHAAYAGASNPQGRYLIPSVIIALVYFTLLIRSLHARFSVIGHTVTVAALLFMALCSGMGLRTSGGDPYLSSFRSTRNLTLSQSEAVNYLAMSSGSNVSQAFVTPNTRVNKIMIRMAMYDRTNIGTFAFAVTDSAGKTLYRTTGELSSLFEGWVPFEFPTPLTTGPGEMYRFSFAVLSSPPANEVAVLLADSNAYPAGGTWVNEKPVETDLAFRIY
jgi:hypothetical protein